MKHFKAALKLTKDSKVIDYKILFKELSSLPCYCCEGKEDSLIWTLCKWKHNEDMKEYDRGNCNV